LHIDGVAPDRCASVARNLPPKGFFLIVVGVLCVWVGKWSRFRTLGLGAGPYISSIARTTPTVYGPEIPFTRY
jgi:hypothetical protein